MKTTKQAIYGQQQDWAARHHVTFDAKGYTATVAENLFQPLSEAAQAEFGLGAGSEMKGKMRALHSSSAIVCNVFDHWCNRPLEPLAAALGAPANADHLHFEQIYLTSIGSRPHLDVAFCGDKIKPFVIESKFVEPYGSDKSGIVFKHAYFPEDTELWTKHGLTNCQDLAQKVDKREIKFSRLDAPQLLKHILGLANKFGTDFTLLYLWYDYPSAEAADHRKEIDTFVQHLGGEIDFRAMTYQELFQKMQGNSTVDEKYIAYLRERYFA
jgi:hypothetical protein